MTQTNSTSTSFKPNDPSEILLVSQDGSRAKIRLHGAHITSWIPSGGEERLFLSKTSEFGPEASIRGGVPVIFPQFNNEGPLPKHGFARRMDWEFVGFNEDQSGKSAVFQLVDSPATKNIWPFQFSLTLTVRVGGRQIETSLKVINTGDAPFTFTTALHTYLKIHDIHAASITGLQGTSYFDSTDRQARKYQKHQKLTFSGEIDRFYMEAPGNLLIQEPDRQMHIEMQGFRDTVVWNPWVEGGAALSDLEPEGYLHMLCVEAAVIEQPVTLAPHDSWLGIQRLVA